MNTNTMHAMGTKAIYVRLIMPINEIAVIIIWLLAGICLGLATSYLQYTVMKNAPVDVQLNFAAVPAAGSNNPLLIAASQIYLLKHPIKERIESLDAKQETSTNPQAMSNYLYDNKSSSLDKLNHSPRRNP